MRSTSRHGRQSKAIGALAEHGRSIVETAREIGVNENHLKNVLQGRTHPCDRCRTSLPKLLGIPLSKLFTPGILATPYQPHLDPRKAVRS